MPKKEENLLKQIPVVNDEGRIRRKRTKRQKN